MMIIKEIYWLNRLAKEAELIITDQKFELKCFSHPFNLNKGDFVDKIQVYEPSNIFKSEFISDKIEKLSDAYAYAINAKLLDKKSGHIKLGDFNLEIDEFLIPNDINNNDFISFTCERLDIW